MIRAMARKNRTSLAADALPGHLAGRGLSGSDIESIVLDAKRRALSRGQEQIAREDLAGALEDFIPSAQGLEKEKQELAAVLECTSLSFLPEEWRTRIAQPDGRARLQERMAAIRRLLEE
jgi:SpoVK/Ycf46/Vps4 family AAA+-type ATPase